MTEVNEKLKRQCSKCGKKWIRNFLWTKSFEKDEEDVLQIYEGCPDYCESGFWFMEEPEIEESPSDKEKIKTHLREIGYKLGEEEEEED
jgi:hypothetical protein